jgi:ATP-independent RNA helicase DbpA
MSAMNPDAPREAAADEFGSLALSPELLSVVAELGFEKLTQIQRETIPRLLEGRDLVGQSQTGSGKTAAFALPMLERLKLEGRVLQGLVLCPTRELSAQVARELRKLGRGRPGLAVAVLAGGEPVREQARALESGVHLAVGTPGRVIDHLQRRTLRVHGVRTLVLDEADRMLDMGFLPDIERVAKALPTPRQTVFFSATFPESIHALSAKYQQEPAWITVEQAGSARPDIVEWVVSTEPAQKLATLRWVLEHHPHGSALIFANFKIGVAEIEKFLQHAGVSVASLHGDLEQRDRDRVMAKFRNGSTRVLVATDVAARGIDLDSLDLVVNFDLPNQPEIYVHRIGRTGRAGKSGLAISLLAPADAAKREAIEAFTGRRFQELRRPAQKSTRSREPGASVPPLEAAMDTLRLSGGRKDKLRPGDILGALTGEAGGLAGDDIGKIEIHERFSFVAVKKAVSQRALASLREGRIKGRRFRVERAE